VAIELNAGDVENQVKMLVRHLTPNGISINSKPSQADLDMAIAVVEAEIFQWLASFNYSVTIADYSDTAKNFLSWYNALGAAYHVELEHTGLVFRPEPATRAEAYYRLYMWLYEQLAEGKLDLVGIGVPVTPGGSAQASITGVSKTDKNLLYENSDAVQPHFKRDQMKHPGRRLPTDLELLS
jgi:hypothetical protein